MMRDGKFVIDFDMKRVSPALLWTFISTANGLAEWFADEVEVEGKVFIFHWEKMCQRAKLMAFRTGLYVKFRWEDSEVQTSYFEMRILSSEITGSRTLQITDYAEDEEEKRSMIEIWENQVDDLRRALGCSK